MARMIACIFLLAAALPLSQALRCYTCDNVGSGEDCIENPELVIGGSSLCQAPNDEYCYTSRVEETGDKVTFNRGCCRVKEASTVCPLGDPFQITTSTNPVYTRYLTRCSDGDLCNDDDGTDGGSGSDSGGGSIIVAGRNPHEGESNVVTGGVAGQCKAAAGLAVLMAAVANGMA